MSLLRDMKLMSRDRIFLARDKSVDLAGVLSCRATLFECLRHNLLSLRQVQLARDVTSLVTILLFRSIAGTGDLLSKHSRYIIIKIYLISSKKIV